MSQFNSLVLTISPSLDYVVLDISITPFSHHTSYTLKHKRQRTLQLITTQRNPLHQCNKHAAALEDTVAASRKFTLYAHHSLTYRQHACTHTDKSRGSPVSAYKAPATVAFILFQLSSIPAFFPTAPVMPQRAGLSLFALANMAVRPLEVASKTSPSSCCVMEETKHDQ